MKTKLNHQLVAAVGLLFTLALQPSTLLAQGSLTPPGPPAPTMKTLQQVEPRVPISSAPFTISQPGSYYLTTNLTVSSGGDAITIAANGVTLDLNGFTIASTAPSATGYGIYINSGLRDIAIQNGHIQGGVTNNGSGIFSGPGFSSGIYYWGVPRNVRVSGVSVSGCLNYGINLDNSESTRVENCVVRTVGGAGIVANTIRGCVALDCGSTVILGRQVSDSRGQSVDIGYGLSATTAQNCYGSSSSSIGLLATTAQNCYGVSTSGTGLYAYATAIGCYGSSSSGTGLDAFTAQNCYGYSGSGGYGLYATTAQNCYGVSTSGTGLYASDTAIGCYGYSSSGVRGLYARNAAFCVGSRPSGRAIEATIANGCWAEAGTNLITYKYNMP